ncbi:hypothetical protein CPB84DRAFT_1734462 [Gymnopilus junonius]|uniref:Uncharacterized protein n=1 Tax=Gymnopilus junonius TaxID=109634 RepID=A0A9P5NGM7_GYMJU|nr:hypothetical protein CPB84DRAFT_1734462 [Gymnopilus junonius]
MKTPLEHSSFKLDVSGIAGFFGGEEAFAAMSSVHLVRGRRWLGWYNSPGSYFVAKKYGVLAQSRIWDGLYPGVNVDPAKMLELDGKNGPRYTAVHSGTRLPTTGHLAYLFANHCDKEPGSPIQKEVVKESPSDVFLTIAKLDDFKKFEGYPNVPDNSFSPFNPLSLIAMGYSFGACAICGIFNDWFCFSMILLGILSNGISCYIIGSGVLQVKRVDPSPNSPPGDGILEGARRVILLKGSEQSVTTITRASFYLHYKSETQYHDIGWSAAALTTQFLLQLFIIPQGTLFGQIMFLSSFAVSWIYNAYLASLDTEALQRGILTKILLQKPVIWTIRFPKRTALVVFVAVYTDAEDPRSFLDEMIPNNTSVWRLVKETITEAILTEKDPEVVVGSKSQVVNELRSKDQGLVQDMLKQASIGYNAAKKIQRQEIQVTGVQVNYRSGRAPAESSYTHTV